eukprot:6054528-Pyramimonas_sp.AAC.1
MQRDVTQCVHGLAQGEQRACSGLGAPPAEVALSGVAARPFPVRRGGGRRLNGALSTEPPVAAG